MTAAAERVPPDLIRQLADGARLVAPVGRRNQRLQVVVRHGEEFERQTGAAVRFVPLVGGTVE